MGLLPQVNVNPLTGVDKQVSVHAKVKPVVDMDNVGALFQRKKLMGVGEEEFVSL